MALTDVTVRSAKRRERIAARIAIGTTFGDVTQDDIDKAARESRAPATLLKLSWMREQLMHAIGHRPLDQSSRTNSWPC